MLIFGTDLEQVQITKAFLSSSFDMKDMGEANVILGIRILREQESITLSQSHYIEKVFDKFNQSYCIPASTPFDPNMNFVKNIGNPISQLEYAKVIGCLMYAMTCTRPDIAYAVGRMNRYTSNPNDMHWHDVKRILKYLKKTKDYGISYVAYPFVLEGFFYASWITYKDEWLRDLLYGIPLWPKPITPISIHCDSVATLVRAYSQVYNGKSRNIGLRHSYVRELITNGVITIDFVRSNQIWQIL